MPLHLVLKVQEPTKKELYKTTGLTPNVLKSHLTLHFNHNHPLQSAHVLSFRPVSEETKEKYYKLFQAGHSAASARHYYETTLMDECEESELQSKFANRSVNPTVQDVSRL